MRSAPFPPVAFPILCGGHPRVDIRFGFQGEARAAGQPPVVGVRRAMLFAARGRALRIRQEVTALWEG